MIGRASIVDIVHIESKGLKIQGIDKRVYQSNFIIGIQRIIKAGREKCKLFSVYTLYKFHDRSYEKQTELPCYWKIINKEKLGF